VLVDVFCIAAGFMLRIIAGTTGLGIAPSQWLLLTGMFVALFLGFAKRRAEWAEGGSDGTRRHVLRLYTTTLLDKFLAMTATGTALCYGLYTVDPKTIAMHQTDSLVYSVPIVLFGLCRYLYLLHSEGTGQNPTVEVFLDPQIVVAGVAWIVVCLWVLVR
jgi:4-hydroxybenzoate polyprenyltransferase